MDEAGGRRRVLRRGVGLCGVLQPGRPENPDWLQTLAALLIFGALATALIAIAVVGRVAWPPARPPAHPAGQLKTGILLTFLAVAMLALGTSSMWWPQSEKSGEQVTRSRRPTGRRSAVASRRLATGPWASRPTRDPS